MPDDDFLEVCKILDDQKQLNFLQGLVDIYTAYNLTLIRRIKGAHSTFVTGSMTQAYLDL